MRVLPATTPSLQGSNPPPAARRAGRKLARPLTALLICACGELPGTAVGTYRITMKLEENTCGESAVHLLDGHRYSVQLRSDERHGWWRIPGQPPLQGSYEAPSFNFESSAVVANEGPDAGPRGCSLRQRDRLTGELTRLPDAGSDQDLDGGAEEDEELDAGEGLDASQAAQGAKEADGGDDDESPLRGEHVFTISAADGNDCRSALAPQGAFDKLPCSLRYSIRGVSIKPF